MNKNFWKNHKKPIIALAPMDGYTDSAFRRICREINPEILVFTEFTSAEGLSHGAKRIMERFYFHPSEQPVIAQIFGSDIPSYALAAQYLEAQGFIGIDINMGCPSKKVVKSEQGVALRKNHDLAFRIIEAVAKHTKLPVSVKTRLGWKSEEDLLAFGLGAKNAGANLITIHGRTYCDSYGSPANFSPIYELKRNLTIPVLCNGGITSLEDGRTKLQNLDGFMIGRASWGNPWIFSEQKKVSPEEKLEVMKRHIRYVIELKGEKYGMFEVRKHIAAYFRSIPNASNLRVNLMQSSDVKSVFGLLDKMRLESA